MRTILGAMIDRQRDLKIDHMAITGDIYHTKVSNISPEFIEILSWWLTELSVQSEVHIVLGNHDGLLNNLSRQDAISPIVAALNNPRIKLYKRSGVYSFAPGYNWGVFGIFDEAGWDRVSPIPGDVNIALYHGPVWGARTESDWRIETDVTSDRFKDWDLALLGDIHRFQFLDYREYRIEVDRADLTLPQYEDATVVETRGDKAVVRLKRPWIAYPGTPAQQSYAEELEHGFLVWDVPKDGPPFVTFEELPNDRPFVTLDWKGDTDLTFAGQRFKKGSRVRIRSQDVLSQIDVQRISARLKDVEPAEITFKEERTLRSTEISFDSGDGRKLGRDDLRKADNLTALVKDYHDDKSDVVWENLNALLSGYLSDPYLHDEAPRNSVWSLKRLEFDNTFGLGEGNVVELGSVNGTVGVFGNSARGKSSFVGTILYALFNATDRGSLKNLHVVNVRKDHCLARATIVVDGVEYLIERQTTKVETKRGTAAPTHLNVFRREADGTMVDLVGEDRKDTERVVKRLLGTVDDCTLTSISTQGSINQFVLNSSSRRMTYLSKFMDLDVFSRVYDLASRDANAMKGQLKAYVCLDETMIATSMKEIETMIEELSSLQGLKPALTHRQDELKARLASAKSTVTADVLSLQKETVRQRKETLQRAARNLREAEEGRDEAQATLQSASEKIKHLDVDDMRRKKEAVTALERRLDVHVTQRRADATALKQLERSLTILNDVPCGDAYPTCMFIKDAHGARLSLEGAKTALSETDAAIDDIKKAMSTIDVDDLNRKIELSEKVQQIVRKIESELVKKTSDVDRMTQALASEEKQLEDAEAELERLQGLFDMSDNERVVADRDELARVNQNIGDNDRQIVALVTKLGRSQSTLERLENDIRIRDELSHRLRHVELVTTAFTKKGLPQRLLNERLPLINAEIGKILNGVVGFTVEMVIDPETEDLEVYIDYGDSRRVIEVASGMEKTIASIAIRVALTNVSTLPRSDMLVIDEGFGTLDAPSREAAARLLKELTNHFRLVVFVTHFDDLKDAADHVIDVGRNEKDARMVFVP